MKIINKKIKVILISQWPNVKNAEYELIEKIKQTDSSQFQITVTDIYGKDVNNGKLINSPDLSFKYDFAISLHYDTPKLLNIPTYLFVANPLCFMHLRSDYSSKILPNILSYDGYLYNGSDVLKNHIKIITDDIRVENHDLQFFPSSSKSSIKKPSIRDRVNISPKLFYCGINWEAISSSSREESLLMVLDSKGIVDIFGPKKFEGINIWSKFKSYKYEIPFDGQRVISTMQGYCAVLALSSPGHIKYATSSSRVFEAIAAGVPVISDENPHVKKLFGDLVYYFNGETDDDKCASILHQMSLIENNPKAAIEKVNRAQELIRNIFSFEVCFKNIFDEVQALKKQNENKRSALELEFSLDVVVLNHDPFNKIKNPLESIRYLHSAIKNSYINFSKINIFFVQFPALSTKKLNFTWPCNVDIKYINLPHIDQITWNQMTKGKKILETKHLIKSQFSCLLDQQSFLEFDHFNKFVLGYIANKNLDLYVASNKIMYQDDDQNFLHFDIRNSIFIKSKKDYYSLLILDSFVFTKKLLTSICKNSNLAYLSGLVPYSIFLSAQSKASNIFYSPYPTVFSYLNYCSELEKMTNYYSSLGYWNGQYNIYSNFYNEFNILYDVNRSPNEREIIDKLRLHEINIEDISLIKKFILKILPLYKFLLKLKRLVKF